MVLVVSITVISGCGNDSELDKRVIDLEDKIKTLEKTINNQSQTIEKQAEVLHNYELETKDLVSTITRIESTVDTMRISEQVTGSIVQAISNSETALIEKSNYNKDRMELTVRYANMSYDDNNQYTGLNRSNETIEISVHKSVPIFLLDRSGTMPPTRVEWNELKNKNLKGIFVNLYKKDEDIVLIQELYIP